MQFRHGRLKSPSSLAAIVRAALVVGTVAIVSMTGIGAYAIYSVSSTLDASAVDIGSTAPAPPPPYLGAFEGGFTMLIVGTDNDADQGDDFGERDGVRNDVTIMLHVSADHQNAVVISFPRDLVIPHPTCTDPSTGESFGPMSAQPLYVAYSRGGLACVAATITDLTGVPIHYAAATSFNGVIALSDAVGGVEVCANDPIMDADSGVDIPAGVSTVSGQSALAFLRNRHGVGNGSDLSRIGSQQQYLASLLRKIRADSTLGDPGKLYQLAQAASHNITPSTSLKGLDTLVSLAMTLKDVDLDRVVFVQYPVTTYVEDANKVQPLYDVADDLFAHILDDRPFGLATDSPGTTSPEAGSEELRPEPGEPQPELSTAAPEVVDGLTGQTATQHTCASAFPG